MNLFKVKLDIKKPTFNNVNFVKGDTAIINAEVNDNGTPITDYLEAHIVIKKSNTLIGMFPMNLLPLSFQFKAEIKEAGKYECVVILTKLQDHVTTHPFSFQASHEWITTIINQEENINVITDLYARANINYEYIFQLFDKTGELQQAINQTNTDILTQKQDLQQDIDTKVSKTTGEEQSIKSRLNLEETITFLKDLIVKGNIIQDSGKFYETVIEILKTYKDEIILREGAISGLLPGAYAGLRFKKYDGVNDGFIVIDKDGTLRIGDIDDLQPQATREENPIANGIAYWNPTKFRFETKPITDFMLKTDFIENGNVKQANNLVSGNFSELTLNQPITNSPKNAVAEIKSIIGKSEVKVKQTELDIANLKVNDTLKNEQILDNGQVRISEKVGIYVIDNITMIGTDTGVIVRYGINSNLIKNNSLDVDQPVFIPNYIQSLYSQRTLISSIGTYYTTKYEIAFVFPSGTTLEQAKDLLRGKKLTYQLAVQNPKEVNLWEQNTFEFNATIADVYRINLPSFWVNNGLKTNQSSALIPTIPIGDYTSNTRHFYTTVDSIFLFIEKSLIDNTVGSNLTEKVKKYLQSTNQKGTFELATPRFAETLGIADVVNPKVVSVGKNLFDKSKLNIKSNYYINDSGVELTSLNTSYDLNYIGVKPDTNYTWSGTKFVTSYSCGVYFFDINKNFISRVTYTTNSPSTFKTPTNAYYIRLQIPNNVISSKSNYADDWQIEYGNVATTNEVSNSTSTSFTETISSIPNTSIADEIKPLANGLFEKTIKHKTVKLWEFGGSITVNTTATNVYRVSFNNFLSLNQLKIGSGDFIGNSFINTFVGKVGYAIDERSYYLSSVDVLMFKVEKPLIDSQVGATLVDKLKAYLQTSNTIFKGELATYEKKIITPKGLLELYEGGTIYLQSDGIISDTVIRYANNDKAEMMILKNEIHRINAR